MGDRREHCGKRPATRTPVAESDRRIAEAALELLRKDRDLDDSVFTPPAAISLVRSGSQDGAT